MKKINTYIVVAVIAFLLVYFFVLNQREPHVASQIQTSPVTTQDFNNHAIKLAFEHKKSNVQVQGAGQVKAVLPDDNQGSRHQKFILRLENGQTVLIAHNIDLSPRLQGLQKGDRVEFYGEYEYTPKGGVIHWTHRDPKGRHLNGWLKFNGSIYQ
ncbi:DUF3465 domain-containing protein [uncultured Acinetobacter sp.]|uniref:DUF3465 domain-containing protein n=1 Tax=uncultured Acinetobacter sp. TaxID=165433 RepID=UPI00259033FB|nr:DUF3465 domain-containing protein [uncultured Acinetobacter sp.]